jgi:hypothetical protein
MPSEGKGHDFERPLGRFPGFVFGVNPAPGFGGFAAGGGGGKPGTPEDGAFGGFAGFVGPPPVPNMGALLWILAIFFHLRGHLRNWLRG